MKTLKSLALLVLVAPILLSGCDRRQQPREWQPYEPVVQAQTASEDIHFAKGQTNLTNQQVQQIKSLTRGYDMNMSIMARVITHNADETLRVHLLKQRVQSIIHVLKNLGIARANIEVVSDTVSSREVNVITVEVDQYLSMAQKCNGWNYSMDRFLRPEGEMDFGCTTAANVTAMVANPKDLLKGRSLGKADGARNDLAVDKYRTGKIKSFDKNYKAVMKN